MATPTPVKTLHLVNKHTFTTRHMEIVQDDIALLWVNTKYKLLSSPMINIQIDGENGPNVAACKTQTSCFSRSLRFYLGNPDCTDKSVWLTADPRGWSEGVYEFPVKGGLYQWKRTHRKELGASRLGSKSFKLMNGDQLLAVFVHTQCLFGKRHEVARIEFFEELPPDQELASLATILGIQERIRQAEQAAAASG